MKRRRAGRPPAPSPHHIVASAARADDRTRVLKQGETFAVFDRFGDIVPLGLGEQGLFHRGTRHLSRLELRVGGARPLLLSSTVRDDNEVVTVDLTNPDLSTEAGPLPHGTLHLARQKFLWLGVCYERLDISNYGSLPAEVSLTLRYDADFADIFEVRGTRRPRRGQRLPDQRRSSGAILSYRGLDRVLRRTVIECSPVALLRDQHLRFDLALEPRQSASLLITFSCENQPGAAPALGLDEARRVAGESLAAGRAGWARVHTSNEQFNDWFNRSAADLHMMVSELPTGPYPYAGVPWFSTPFGRDGIITALELLTIQPELARGVLAFLAATQADHEDRERDAEPGKILHETREGEMAALGEVPFGRYYGSVDATPLFVALAGAYFDRTGNRAFVESLWPSVEKALRWVDERGDVDGDGFVEYQRRSGSGLVHQGWKDSQDAIFHQDGSSAEPPIALSEVQGYVYAARRSAAGLARALGLLERASALERQAEALRSAFEDAFWVESLGTYALALDGGKRPCAVVSSNAGQCLWSGIASPERAARTIERLMREDGYSGFGIRTIAASESRYNPMSYHNGSVWPHDNALIAAGLARYGMTRLAARLLTGLFDASLFLDLHRQPELFCGFPRRTGEGPTLYPVACAPQAWAAGAAFLLLESALGLTIEAAHGRVVLKHASLPGFLDWVELRELRVGDARLDLLLERHHHNVVIQVLNRTGVLDVVAVK